MKKVLFATFALLGLLVTFSACGSDDEEAAVPHYEDVTLNTGDTYVIPDGANWISQEPLIASLSGNTITAEKVGTTSIYNESASFNVTVNPRYTLYEDPCLQWGASIETVQSFMSDYELMGYDEEFVLYSGRGGATFYAYSFENRQLAGSIVYVDAAAYANTLVEFLAERYVVVYVDEEEEVFAGFVNIEENMLIGLRIVELLEEYFVTVMYLPYEATEATAKRSAASFVPQGIPEGLHAVPLKGTEYAKQVVRQFVQE